MNIPELCNVDISRRNSTVQENELLLNCFRIAVILGKIAPVGRRIW